MPPNNSYQTVYWVDCQRQMYAKLSRIGKELSTHAQEFQYEMQLREQAEQILKAKKIVIGGWVCLPNQNGGSDMMKISSISLEKL